MSRPPREAALRHSRARRLARGLRLGGAGLASRSQRAPCPRPRRGRKPDHPRFPYGRSTKTSWNLYAAEPQGRPMSIDATAITPDANEVALHSGPRETVPKLMLGAIGVVYGDIGTSPVYTMKESFL